MIEKQKKPTLEYRDENVRARYTCFTTHHNTTGIINIQPLAEMFAEAIQVAHVCRQNQFIAYLIEILLEEDEDEQSMLLKKAAWQVQSYWDKFDTPVPCPAEAEAAAAKEKP